VLQATIDVFAHIAINADLRPMAEPLKSSRCKSRVVTTISGDGVRAKIATRLRPRKHSIRLVVAPLIFVLLPPPEDAVDRNYLVRQGN
jgi:hypothetical protein